MGQKTVLFFKYSAEQVVNLSTQYKQSGSYTDDVREIAQLYFLLIKTVQNLRSTTYKHSTFLQL
jgi:ABC-type hemin transport system ATPase subunit